MRPLWHAVRRRFTSAPSAALRLNAPESVRYAHRSPGASYVHIFAQHGTGITAACHYAPGSKLEISAHDLVDAKALVACLQQQGLSQAIFHGFEPTFTHAVMALHRAGVKCSAVWHGSSTQWFDQAERDAFAQVIALRAQGVLQRLAAARPYLSLVSPWIESEPIFNFPPHLPASSFLEPARSPPLRALVPAPANWVKNIHTNVYAAANEPRIQQIVLTATSPEHAGIVSTNAVNKLHHCAVPTREDMFALMRSSAVVLNASLTECSEPMVALEAASVGTPCVVAAHSLLRSHPFAQLTYTHEPSSIHAVLERLGAVLDMQAADSTELDDMMADYLAQWTKCAHERLASFVG